METGFISLILAVAFVCVFIGIVIGKRSVRNDEIHGSIYVYQDDVGTAPSLFLEYNTSIENIASRKQVVFDVKIVK